MVKSNVGVRGAVVAGASTVHSGNGFPHELDSIFVGAMAAAPSAAAARRTGRMLREGAALRAA